MPYGGGGNLIANREVVLRLATNRDVDRKLKTATSSRYFWLYSLSLWDPDAFWKCMAGASAFAAAGLLLARGAPGVLLPTQLSASVAFEYFLFGLVLMWAFSLGSWLNPKNFAIIYTLIFRLYRKNMTVDDLSPEEMGRLFPETGSELGSGGRADVLASLKRAKDSPVLRFLALGTLLATLTVAVPLLA
jgi:hypothetical protein